jgi:hypothetical protein
VTMTEEQRSQFLAFAEHIASKLPELNKLLLAEVNRAGQAFSEVAGVLAKNIDQNDPLKVRQFFLDAQTSHKKLFQENQALAEASISALVEIGKTPRSMPTEPSEAHTALEREEILRQIRWVEFGLAIENFFTGMAFITIQLSLEDYLNACEVFWGRKIGSHDAKRRFGQVVKQVFIAAPPTALGIAFPFLAIPLGLIGPAIEAVSQWRETPRKKVFKDLKDGRAILRRVETLTETASALLDHMGFVQGNAGICVKGVTEAREARWS